MKSYLINYIPSLYYRDNSNGEDLGDYKRWFLDQARTFSLVKEGDLDQVRMKIDDTQQIINGDQKCLSVLDMAVNAKNDNVLDYFYTIISRDLIEEGVSLDDSLLHWAAKCNQSDEILTDLLSKDDRIDFVSYESVTPLTIAATLNHTRTVKALIKNGANVNCQGIPPIIGAASRGHTQMVEFLIDHGADVNAAQAFGDTALLLAIKYGHTETARTLINHSADINVVGINGTTALFLAINRAIENSEPLDSETCQLTATLLRRHANIDRLIGFQIFCSPLLKIAAVYNIPHALTDLFIRNVDVNTVFDNNMTALHYAAAEGCIEAIEVLLANGADPLVKSNDGHTPLTLAMCSGHTAAVRRLKSTPQYQLDDALVTLNNRLQSYFQSARKVRHGVFAGQLPCDLREMKKSLQEILDGTGNIIQNLQHIIELAKDNHPVLSAAKKCLNLLNSGMINPGNGRRYTP